MANDLWTDEELAAAIRAYRSMQAKERDQEAYSKRQVYRDLSAQHGRSESSWEYRMQNISSVLQEQGEAWIYGLKPAGNVGGGVGRRILNLLDDHPLKPRSGKPQPIYKSSIAGLRRFLIRLSKEETAVTYGELMLAFGINRFSLKEALRFLGNDSLNRGEPILTSIVVNRATRECSAGFAKEFGVDPAVERARTFGFWAVNQAEPLVEADSGGIAERAARFASIARRPEQAAFRRRVFLAYGGRCAISGCDIVSVLDAAHRVGRDWRAGHNTGADGILLRKDLHGLYDSGLLTFQDDGLVSIADRASAHYAAFAGVQLTAPKK